MPVLWDFALVRSASLMPFAERQDAQGAPGGNQHRDGGRQVLEM